MSSGNLPAVFPLNKKMKQEQMEKKEIEKELSFLLERTLSMEDELNSLIKMED